MARPNTLPARWLTLALVVAALPLLATTCGTQSTGTRAFSKNSLIIPMDACYQGDGITAPTACPGSADRGDVLRAYGLVYRLLQANIPVYWVIQNGKTSHADVDLSVAWSAGAPVGKYDWSNGTFATPPPNNTTHQASYRGGPFVVDGAWLAQAHAVLQSAGIQGTFGASPAVNVHVSNVAFSAHVARAMNGGWSAGGNTPPPIALLNITGADGLNSVAVLQGYLDAAGLGTIPGAGGTASGPHGSIYDRLDVGDFLPDLASSRLGTNGYRVLWAPHWVGTCPTTAPYNCLATSYTPAQLHQVRETIRTYVSSGKDFFAQCSAITTLESGIEFCPTVINDDTTSTSQLMTTKGMDYNLSGFTNSSCNRTYADFVPLTYTAFSSPFMQLAEFPFKGVSGAVANYRPGYNSLGSAWKSGVTHLVASSTYPLWDMFTLKGASSGSGNTLYLAGHDYKGQVAGTRLVLNTLFNLGSTCVTTHTPCDTGQLGVCGQGQTQCVNELPTCVPVNVASAEICDGLDNDCNGLVDDGVTRSCYGGPSETLGVGACVGGIQACAAGTWGACSSEIQPAAEICNAVDDDCDSQVDDLAEQPCYEGPVGTADVGACRAGTQPCSGGQWGLCTGQILPSAEQCGDGLDNNCDGQVDEGCGCPDGATQPCYGGAVGTAGVGPCRFGLQACTAGVWGACVGQVLPVTEACNELDDDCDGQINEGGVCDVCSLGQVQPCYTGPLLTADTGLCRPGTQGCVDGQWATCTGQVLPGAELCNGLDDDCDGAVDDDPLCPAFHECVRGVCVPNPCSNEFTLCPEGFSCDPSRHCVPTDCGGGATCLLGQACRGGTCVDPCASVTCGAGAVCAGGLCTGGGCYASGCPDGGLCRNGACMGDPCTGVTCPAGSFCRDGDCVQSCAFRQCPQGQSCQADGFCVSDACASTTCGAGQACDAGSCLPDPCVGVGCGPKQVCQMGRCVDNPCNGVTCPVGTCVAGQCYGGLRPDGGTDGGMDEGELEDAGLLPLEPPDAGASDAGTDAGDGGTGSGGGIRGVGGCGCSSTSPAGLFPFLILVTLGRIRRRHTPTAGRKAALLAVIASVLAACGGTRPPFSTDAGLPSSACGPSDPCPVGESCEEGLCTQGAPRDGGISQSPDAGSVDGGAPVRCERCGGSTCVDHDDDPLHCGACNSPCSAGELCVDGQCGPSGAIAPWIGGTNPSQLPQGAPATVIVTGERFQPGATVRVLGARGPVPATATVATGASLSATLDLSHEKPGTLDLRVVNPDKVISNAVSLQVTPAVPFISKITPNSGVEGQVITVRVDGTGYLPDPSTRCKISGPGVPSLGLPTQALGPTAVDCTLDLTNFQPGSYAVVLTNDGLSFSNSVPFAVVPATPVLTTLAPPSGRPGAKLTLFLRGSGFDTTSVVRFNGQPLPTTYVTRTDLMAAPLDLAQVATGTYPVTVMNGGNKLSNALSFTVNPNPPVLLQMTPTSALQGEQLTLQLSGSGFEQSSVVHVFEPGGADVALPTTIPSDTQATAPYSLSGKPAGNYLVEIITGGTLPSNPLVLQVRSNLATLTALSPAGGAQGEAVSLALSGSNILPGAVAWISGNGLAPTQLSTTVVSTSSAHVTGLSLAHWATGNYVVSLVNPGAAASNTVGFTVFAGPPTLTSLAPSSAALGAPVTATLTGENFAQPDAQGLGGSTVHARCVACGVLDSTVPATVLSPTQLSVVFDTSTAPPGTYEVSVWNPGGTPPPQKSGTLTFTVTP
jgi:hypothetical protein